MIKILLNKYKDIIKKLNNIITIQEKRFAK
jgi:hypothetical protein